MSDEPGSASPAANAEVHKRRSISMVWLIPVVAAVIGAGIAYETISSQGPTITLVFQDGAGLEAGKTKIKYRSVDVGVLKSVEISEDIQSVIAEAELGKRAAPYLNENTVFWMVEPRISLSGISGLDTLVSGNYIAILPGDGPPRLEFEVLEEPPLTAEHRNALSIDLSAEDIGTISAGSPVTYRTVNVGEVERYELVDGGGRFVIHVLIDHRYSGLVKQGTQFWNASGVDVSIAASGITIDTGSLASILAGGIAFDTPAWSEDTELAENGAVFDLYGSHSDALKARQRVKGLNIAVEAGDGSIGEGSPVYYRKFQVGHVGEAELSADATTVRYQVHIDDRYRALVRKDSRFWNASGFDIQLGMDGLALEAGSLQSILQGGLSFATPSRPGKLAENGDLFAVYEEPKPLWLAWTPKIWIDPESDTQPVAHVLPAKRTTPRGLRLILESDAAASVQKGDPVYYREVQVGEIGSHELSKDARTVRITAYVEPKYATLVRANSRFWNASGIGVSFGLGGLDIQTESLESILAGGVAFATPDEPGAPVEPGVTFLLHPEPEDDWKEWSPTIWMGKPLARAVQSAAATGARAASTPPVSAGLADDEPGFFSRLFGAD